MSGVSLGARLGLSPFACYIWPLKLSDFVEPIKAFSAILFPLLLGALPSGNSVVKHGKPKLYPQL